MMAVEVGLWISIRGNINLEEVKKDVVFEIFVEVIYYIFLIFEFWVFGIGWWIYFC